MGNALMRVSTSCSEGSWKELTRDGGQEGVSRGRAVIQM